jgi:hypothetical protein
MKKKSLPQVGPSLEEESPLHLKRTFWIDLVFILLIAFWFIFPAPRGQIINPLTQLLFADTSRHCQTHEIMIHNSNMMTFLQANLARESSEIGVAENTKSQTRLFYVAILAAMIVVLSTIKENSHPAMIGIPIILIVSMYLLEIHQDDLNRRGVDYYRAEIHATETLVDLKPTDMNWYRKDGYALQNASDSVHNTNTRIARKIQAALRPSVDQIIFYFIPMCLVCQPLLLFYPYSKRRKRDSSDEE